MGLLDRLFGRRGSGSDQAYDGYQHVSPQYGDHPGGGYQPAPPPQGGTPTDQQAVERYRYLLRTAPPDQIEEAHAEAFAKLTPAQRQEVLVQLAAAVPSSERPRSDDPRTLARAATRAEVRQPGTLERAFGPGPGGHGGGYGGGGYGGYGRSGPGFGSMVGASLLGTVGGLVVGTAVADALFDTGLGDGGLFGGGDEEAYAQGYEDAGGDYGGDPGGDLAGGADPGGDLGGDFGGDFGSEIGDLAGIGPRSVRDRRSRQLTAPPPTDSRTAVRGPRVPPSHACSGRGPDAGPFQHVTELGAGPGTGPAAGPEGRPLQHVTRLVAGPCTEATAARPGAGRFSGTASGRCAAATADRRPAAPAGRTGSRGRTPTTPSRRGTRPAPAATACRRPGRRPARW
jgi:hypothetical protein